jgi:hypothetical protein
MRNALTNIQWWLAGIFFRRVIRESYQEGYENGRIYGQSLEKSAMVDRLEKKHLRAFKNPTLALGYDYALGVVQNNITIKEQEEE